MPAEYTIRIHRFASPGSPPMRHDAEKAEGRGGASDPIALPPSPSLRVAARHPSLLLAAARLILTIFGLLVFMVGFAVILILVSP